ncbi:hypothetical protein HanPSC8_Chr11g0464361 [Helianthus annuus]|nr:hypothetical protein HanPSC8_Chr11g0464361 [Helianthus annuus]
MVEDGSIAVASGEDGDFNYLSQTYKLYSSEREREERIGMEDILIEGVTCCYNKLGEHPVFRRRVHLNLLNFLILCCLISFMCQLFL